MKNSNYVDVNDVVQIKDCETAIVTGGKCNEAIVLITNEKKPFGLSVYPIEVGDLEVVVQFCRKSGFPNHYIGAALNREGERYFSAEGRVGGRTLCVKEVEENGEYRLKTCVVVAKDFNACNEMER